MLRQQLRYLLCAMGFFTRIPLPAWVGYQPDDLDRAAPYFPLIGLLVGAIAVVRGGWPGISGHHGWHC